MDPVVIGLAFALVFYVLGVLGKVLARSGFRWEDCYLGLEFMLASLSGAAIYAFELGKSLESLDTKLPNSAEIAKKIGKLNQLNTVFLVAAMLGYFVVATFHMCWERQPDKPIRQRLILGLLCGGFGFCFLSGFIIYVKKGMP